VRSFALAGFAAFVIGAWVAPPTMASAAPPDDPVVPADSRVVDLRAWFTDEIGTPSDVFGNLADGDVLRITVTGGEPGPTAVRQCTNGVLDWFATCLNPYPVLFDEDGRAEFQYQLVDPGNCGALGACLVVVGDPLGSWIAYSYTVFGADAPPPPVVALVPRGSYAVGDRIEVVVSSMLPGTPVSIYFCGDECDEPATGVADSDGRHTNTVTVTRCEPCVVVVVAGVRESMTWVTLTDGPTAAYDVLRLLAGLAAVVGFLLAAWLILGRTDWRPPSEAATPEFDGPWRRDDPDDADLDDLVD
jgi:xanthosine utilization system XapX-like protein